MAGDQYHRRRCRRSGPVELLSELKTALFAEIYIDQGPARSPTRPGRPRLCSRSPQAGAAIPATQVRPDVFLAADDRSLARPLPAHGMADPLPAGRYRGRTVLMWVMQIIGPVGFYGFASIAPIVLLAKGFDLSHSLMYSALTALGYPLGSLVSVYLIERIERRTLLIVVAMFGVAFGLATNITLVIAAGVMTTISTSRQSNFTQTYKRSCSPPPTAAPPSACRMQFPAWSAPCCRWAPARGRRAGALYTCCALLLAGMALAIGYSDRPPTTNSSTQTQSETRSESLGLNHSMRPRASKPLD
jgi:hypothetical protein